MALFLRTCKKDFTSHGGFKWPETVGAIVTDPDWSSEKCCGKGLHGLLEGRFDSSMLDWSNDAVWMVVESDLEKAIDLDGKHKFESCEIKFIGDRIGATKYLTDLNFIGVHGSSAALGYYSSATLGDRSSATLGYYSSVSIKWWDSVKSRFRISTGYTEEGGLKSNTKYKLDDFGNFVEVK